MKQTDAKHDHTKVKEFMVPGEQNILRRSHSYAHICGFYIGCFSSCMSRFLVYNPLSQMGLTRVRIL